MKHALLTVFVWLWATCVFAQPAPTIVTTLQTTNTGSNSVCVGCAIGSLTATGTLNAGGVFANVLGAEAGYVEIQSNVPVSTTFRLYNNSGTLMWNGTTLATGGSISGTTNTIPLFTSSSSVGNSIMTQSGTTITVANTLSATTLTGTLSTASQPNVTGVGTITTGTWNATKIGLLYGGTNADLSGTGGTSQFLRQASVGAAITVVRPAVADLSDNANVALLNAANTFTTTPQSLNAGNNGPVAINVQNTTNSTTAFGQLGIANSGSTAGINIQTFAASYTTSGSTIANGSRIIGSGSGGFNLVASDAAGALSFRTGGDNLRWGINSAGDFTFGASSHIADSSGTPTISSGFGTSPSIAGTDYAFTVTVGTGASVISGVVAFGHTWNTAPVCVGSAVSSAMAPLITNQSTTTQLTITFTTGSWSGQIIPVLCRGT